MLTLFFHTDPSSPWEKNNLHQNLVLASVYNNYKVQLRERARAFHENRRLGLVAAFEKLDTNQSGFVRIRSCARVLNELSRPNVSLFHWENSAFLETQRTRAMLQSWWNKVVENLEADKDEEGSKLGTKQVEEDGRSEEQSKTTARVSRPVDDLINLDAFCEIINILV